MSAFKTKKITHSGKSFSSKRKNDNTLEENDKTIEQKTSLPVSSKRSIKTRIILNVPEKDLEIYRAQVHPIASGMDIEPDNFIIPQEQRESFQEMRMSLDDLEMVGGNFIKLRMARDEIKRRLKDLGILES